MVETSKVTYNGINPYYLLDAANCLFDHSVLSPSERCIPLLRFQETIILLITVFRIVHIVAPSQSGKTTVAEIIAFVWAVCYPGSRILILSSTEEQANRLLDDIKVKFMATVVLDEFELTDKDNTRYLRLSANRSTIKALPHSIKAVTGNPADLVICDEMGIWSESKGSHDDPASIYAECLVRTGRTGGKILNISTFRGEGKPDRTADKGYVGNFFNYLWNEVFKTKGNADKESIAVKFNVTVNPYLLKNLPALTEELKKLGKGEEYVREHYWNEPRKSAGSPLFRAEFRREYHIKPHTEIIAHKLNPDHPLFLCFDPGLKKAAVLGQADLDHPRLIYLEAWLHDEQTSPQNMIKSIYGYCLRAYPDFFIQIFCDVAGRKKNDQTYLSWEEIIYHETNQWPTSKYQHISPGIQLMKGFMRRVDGFYVSDKAPLLIDAFETGLVRHTQASIEQEFYMKDGYWEHVGDAARYPPYFLFGSLVPDGTTHTNLSSFGHFPNSGYTNYLTGY